MGRGGSAAELPQGVGRETAAELAAGQVDPPGAGVRMQTPGRLLDGMRQRKAQRVVAQLHPELPSGQVRHPTESCSDGTGNETLTGATRRGESRGVSLTETAIPGSGAG